MISEKKTDKIYFSSFIFLRLVVLFSYRLFNQKRELEILSIQPVDAGRYRCVAANEAGSLEVSVDLTVGGKSPCQGFEP